MMWRTSLGSVSGRTYDGGVVRAVKEIFEKGMNPETEMVQELKMEKM